MAHYIGNHLSDGMGLSSCEAPSIGMTTLTGWLIRVRKSLPCFTRAACGSGCASVRGGGEQLADTKTDARTGQCFWVKQANVGAIAEWSFSIAAGSHEFPPYQLSIVVQWTTMAFTGNGESGFESGEGA